MNIAVHWVAEPIAIFALLALTTCVPFFNTSLMWPVLIALLMYFAALSTRIALAFVPNALVFVWAIPLPGQSFGIATWAWAAPTFAIAWVTLLIGHKIEGRVPSVFQNPHLIFVGPAWLMRRLFRKLGLKDP